MNRGPKRQENERDISQPANLSLFETIKTRSFWLVVFVWFFFAFSFFLVSTHLVPHVTDMGFSPLEAASILSVIGAVAIAGRVIMGTISDRIGRKATAVTCALIQTAALGWLVWSQDMWMFYVFAVIFGFAWGGLGPSTAALIGETFGLSRLGSILGVLEFGFGIGAAIGPVIGGLVFDISNSYYMAFVFAIAAMLIVTILIVLVRRETDAHASSNVGANY